MSECADDNLGTAGVKDSERRTHLSALHLWGYRKQQCGKWPLDIALNIFDGIAQTSLIRTNWEGGRGGELLHVWTLLYPHGS